MRVLFAGTAVCLAFACAHAQESALAAASGSALIEGSVVNRLTGAPVKRAHVMYLPTASAAGVEVEERSVDTDANGRFSTRLDPGKYHIWVERAGFSRLNYGASSPQQAGELLTLAPGEERRDLAFRLPPLGVISGRVLDEDGDPISGAGVQILKISYASGRKTLTPFSSTTANDRGEYRAYGLPPARYFLLFTQPSGPLSKPSEKAALMADTRTEFAPLYYPGVPDFGSANSIALAEGAEAQDTDVRLRRIPVSTVRGRVASPVEAFADGQVQVFLVPRDADAASSISRISAVVEHATGRFELHGVAPGAYVLAATQSSRGHLFSARMAVDVPAAGRTDELIVPLANPSEILGTVEYDGGNAESLRGSHVNLADLEGISPSSSLSASVDSTGSFRFPAVTAGVWDLSIAPLPAGAWFKSAAFDGRDVSTGKVETSSERRSVLHIVAAGNAARCSGSVVHDGRPRRATVVLVPADAQLRGNPSLYISGFSDDTGKFSLSGIRPGTYKLFAFENVEPFAWLDPDFLSTVESSAQEVTFGEGEEQQRQINSISSDGLTPTP